MCSRLQRSSVYVRELYAITEAVKKWRQYLIGRHFHIFTDQKSLKELLTQTIQTPEQQKWAAKLQGFSFEIYYKPGKTNLVADALSRKSTDDTAALLLIVSSTIPHLLEDLRKFYTSHAQGQQLLQHLTANSDSCYTFKDGLLFFKERIFIPDLPDWRTAIISEYHNSPSAGHSGAKPTLSRLAASFLWPGAHKDVKTWVQQCSVCQQNKYLPSKKTRSITTLGNTTTGMGRSLHGFYHTFAKFSWPHSNLGRV
jgi:hypothetical protein